MATSEVGICNLALSRIGANTITSLTADAAKEDRLCNTFYAQLRDETLKNFAWNFAMKATPLNRVDLYDDSTVYSDKVSILNVATSNPVRLTFATNNYSTGMIVRIWDVGGTTEINDLDFEATANTASYCYLLGVDGGKYGTYTTGGYAIRREPMSDYSLGYTYTVPSDCLKAIRLDSQAEFEIFGDTLGKRLLTTDSLPVLVYISKVTDVTLFPDDFVEVLVSRLARELIMPLLGTKDGSVVRRELTQDLQSAMAVAKKNNCHEHSKLYSFKSTWNSARK
jgi:hypothetical protein